MNKRIFVYLIYLLLLTSIITSVTFSKYTLSIGGSDTARIARPVFSYEPVSATLNGDGIAGIASGITLSDMMPGDKLVYNFRVHNFEGDHINQVTLKYEIMVSFDPPYPEENLPFTYSLVPAGTYPSAGGDWVYLGFGEKQSHSYTLTVDWDEDKDDSLYQDKQQSIKVWINTWQVD